MKIWLTHLKAHGVSEVLVNTHWLHDQVASFVRDRKENGPIVHLSHESRLLGSGGTLWANQDWVQQEEPFFIIYGDNLTNVDLRKLLGFHKGHGLPFTLGVFRTENPTACGIVELSNDGTVTSFVEKPKKPATDLAAAGIYVADARFFDYFPPDIAEDFFEQGNPLDLGYHVIPRLVGHMKGYVIEEPLLDIGTRQSYLEAQELWNEIFC